MLCVPKIILTYESSLLEILYYEQETTKITRLVKIVVSFLKQQSKQLVLYSVIFKDTIKETKGKNNFRAIIMILAIWAKPKLPSFFILINYLHSVAFLLCQSSLFFEYYYYLSFLEHLALREIQMLNSFPWGITITATQAKYKD